MALFVALCGTGYALTSNAGKAETGPAKAFAIHDLVKDEEKATIFKKGGLTLKGKCELSTLDFEVTARSEAGGAFKSVGQAEGGAAFFAEDPGLEGELDIFAGNPDAGVESAGAIYWDTKDGRVLTVEFQTESNPYSPTVSPSCMFAGTAVYGD